MTQQKTINTYNILCDVNELTKAGKHIRAIAPVNQSKNHYLIVYEEQVTEETDTTRTEPVNLHNY